MTAKLFTIPKAKLAELSLQDLYKININLKNLCNTVESEAAHLLTFQFYSDTLDEIVSRTPQDAVEALYKWLGVLDFDNECADHKEGRDSIYEQSKKILGVH